MTVVVDASLIIGTVAGDERQPAVQAQMVAWKEAGEDLNAPGVLPYEIANVFARWVFDRTLAGDGVAAIWRDLAALGVRLHPFDLTRDGPQVAAVTARLRRRHATDSTYVCLAQRLGATMWTLDGALARNAASVGLPVELLA